MQSQTQNCRDRASHYSADLYKVPRSERLCAYSSIQSQSVCSSSWKLLFQSFQSLPPVCTRCMSRQKRKNCRKCWSPYSQLHHHGKWYIDHHMFATGHHQQTHCTYQHRDSSTGIAVIHLYQKCNHFGKSNPAHAMELKLRMPSQGSCRRCCQNCAESGLCCRFGQNCCKQSTMNCG